jgi:hypothetical protein
VACQLWLAAVTTGAAALAGLVGDRAAADDGDDDGQVARARGSASFWLSGQREHDGAPLALHEPGADQNYRARIQSK